ncbi:MAG: hypothetical protein ACFFDN_30155 [Candidatus Hodarchaeota archaeon]
MTKSKENGEQSPELRIKKRILLLVIFLLIIAIFFSVLYYIYDRPYFEESKKFSKYEAYLRIKERRALYGDNYKSPKKRIKRYITMLGFAPYDGYDFEENKYHEYSRKKADKHYKTKLKIRINAQYHHMGYDPSNDNEENHAFFPSKHPKDAGKKVNYMIHEKISGLEAILKDKRTSRKQKEEAFRELEKIKQRSMKNASIITQAFHTKDESLLDGLIGWDKQSITKIKRRLKDTELNWCSGLNEYIPKDKYGKKLSTQEFNELLRELKKK